MELESMPLIQLLECDPGIQYRVSVCLQQTIKLNSLSIKYFAIELYSAEHK